MSLLSVKKKESLFIKSLTDPPADLKLPDKGGGGRETKARR